MSVSIGNVRIYMGPDDLGGPDDLEFTIVGFVAAARDELLVAVQELQSEAIARALTDASGRGVRVKVILERRYLGTATPPSDPFGPGGTNDENRTMNF